ncbi:MAG: acylneuraminate cytidylyltransferase family protein [Phycisphaerales bacterium]|nr:acylneuraminate cytidylyltransferase family protein [Phycisphaerales bacterium]
MNSSQQDAIAVIIGRAGSKGLPGKNSRMVAGLPMVAHAIGHARDSRHVRKIVVSTDGEEIARAARETGTEVVMRPPLLAGDTASVDEAVRHAVESLGVSHGIVVILYANVPVRPHGLVDRAIDHLVSTGADSVQSYESVGKKHPWWMSRMDDDGRITPWHRNDVYRRQDLPEVWFPDGGVIAVTRESLFTVDPDAPHAFLGTDRRGIRNGPGEVIDVDDEIDLMVAEAILQRQQACQTVS